MAELACAKLWCPVGESLVEHLRFGAGGAKCRLLQPPSSRLLVPLSFVRGNFKPQDHHKSLSGDLPCPPSVEGLL